MGLKYEPFSEPLHIVELLRWNLAASDSKNGLLRDCKIGVNVLKRFRTRRFKFRGPHDISEAAFRRIENYILPVWWGGRVGRN